MAWSDSFLSSSQCKLSLTDRSTAAFAELFLAGLAAVVVESCSDGAAAILSGILEKKHPQRNMRQTAGLFFQANPSTGSC